MLDVRAEWHQALGLLAVFSMVAAQGDKLLANRTTTMGLSLAVLRVLDYPFHLLTAWQTTICIATLTRVHQRLNTPLNRLLAGLLWVGLFDVCW